MGAALAGMARVAVVKPTTDPPDTATENRTPNLTTTENRTPNLTTIPTTDNAISNIPTPTADNHSNVPPQPPDQNQPHARWGRRWRHKFPTDGETPLSENLPDSDAATTEQTCPRHNRRGRHWAHFKGTSPPEDGPQASSDSAFPPAQGPFPKRRFGGMGRWNFNDKFPQQGEGWPEGGAGIPGPNSDGDWRSGCTFHKCGRCRRSHQALLQRLERFRKGPENTYIFEEFDF